MDIISVFEVTEYRTGKQYREFVNGIGQKAIKDIRKLYPKFTKFVLEGFEIEGIFVPLDVNRRY